MSGAQWMSVYIVAALAAFVAWDLYYWRKGKRTLSQWVIVQQKKKGFYRALTWCFCLALILTGLWLIVHWELIDIGIAL